MFCEEEFVIKVSTSTIDTEHLLCIFPFTEKNLWIFSGLPATDVSSLLILNMKCYLAISLKVILTQRTTYFGKFYADWINQHE